MSIKCEICGSDHDPATPVDDNDTQGEDCAACVMEHEDKYYILGVYGSTHFDADLFMFLNEPPEEWIDADPVCDRCIQKVIDQGLVEKIDGEFPFGPPWADAGIDDGIDEDLN